MDFATPGAGFLVPVFDEVFEAFQVPFDTRAREAQSIADLFLGAFGFVGDRHPHQRFILAGILKRDNALVLFSPNGAPCDPPIGNLLSYLRIPFQLFPA